MTVANTSVPVVTGTARQGQTLHTTNGSWTFDLDYLTYAYRWLRCDAAGANCVAIPGAISANYLLGASDVGKTVRSEVTATEVANAPGGTPIPSNGIVNAGGTYTGSHTGQVQVTTTSPVVFSNASITQNSTSAVLVTTVSGADVTFSHCTITGNGQMGNDPRFLQSVGLSNLLVENCDITYTRGINIQEVSSGATIRITKNSVHNVQGAGGPGSGAVGNFVQLQVVTLASSIEIDWNQVINEYNKSYPEDIISCYFSTGMYCHDNYLQHQSKPGNTGGSSQNSITLEGDARINNCLVEDNQVVDAFGIAIFYTALTGQPHDNMLHANRIIGDRYLPNGAIKANGWGSPLGIKSGVGPNNHAHDNVVGYVSYDGSRQTLASNLPGASGGAAAEAALNTYVADPINAASEAAEWTIWQQKLSDNSITIGA